MNALVEQTNSELQMRQSQKEWTKEQVQLIKDTVCKGATDDELKLFLYVSNKVGLDPLAKQIYAVARWDSKLQRNTFTHQTGIDGFRVVAERSSKYAGQLGPFWCGEDGVWKDVWLEKTPPRAAKIGVLRKDFTEPLWATANWDAYCQTTKDGRPTQFWLKMGPLMLAKVAEALGLRKAFPQDLSGIYCTDEMQQAESPVETIANKKEEAKTTSTRTTKTKETDEEKNSRLRKDIEEIKKEYQANDGEIVDADYREVNEKAEEKKAEKRELAEIKDNIKSMLSTLTVNLKTVQEKGEFLVKNVGVSRWSDIEKMKVDDLLRIEANLLAMF